MRFKLSAMVSGDGGGYSKPRDPSLDEGLGNCVSSTNRGWG